ncbi:MAG: translation initiation factor IF-2 subunit beta, partial [Nitrososphaerota archaeon]|nr:translation initiation factor IF-2 subunit beta [Nitrososphaerota archaeon]
AKTYVQCPSCSKMDTKIVKEGRLTFIQCEVCGSRNPVKSLG